MKLNRTQLLWIGIGIISFYYLLNKIEFIAAANYTHGKVISSYYSGKYSHSVIQFQINNERINFEGERNVMYELEEKVAVIFLPEDPVKAYVWSFLGFWYRGLLYCIVPLVFWCAFVLSAYNEKDEIHFRFQKKKAEPKDSASENKKRLE